MSLPSIHSIPFIPLFPKNPPSSPSKATPAYTPQEEAALFLQGVIPRISNRSKHFAEVSSKEKNLRFRDVINYSRLAEEQDKQTKFIRELEKKVAIAFYQIKINDLTEKKDVLETRLNDLRGGSWNFLEGQYPKEEESLENVNIHLKRAKLNLRAMQYNGINQVEDKIFGHISTQFQLAMQVRDYFGPLKKEKRISQEHELRRIQENQNKIISKEREERYWIGRYEDHKRNQMFLELGQKSLQNSNHLAQIRMTDSETPFSFEIPRALIDPAKLSEKERSSVEEPSPGYENNPFIGKPTNSFCLMENSSFSS